MAKLAEAGIHVLELDVTLEESMVACVNRILSEAGHIDALVNNAGYGSYGALEDVALSSGAHMHLRGSAYTMEAVLPDGTVELITDVPEYDFNWQSNYVLAEPVSMPKGSKLRVTSVWDNSADNPLNPDPAATVRYGPWTNDEMINAWSHVVLVGERLGLEVDNGRVVDRFPDAQESEHPFLIQSLPQANSFQRDADKIKAHDDGS